MSAQHSLRLQRGTRYNPVYYSQCDADRDRQAGQREAYQQHPQEEEVGAGGSERTCGWTAVVNQRDLRAGSRTSETERLTDPRY